MIDLTMDALIHAYRQISSIKSVSAPLNFFADKNMADYKQVKFPKTKRKRTQRKWAKQSKNYAYIPWKTIYQIKGMGYVMHPSLKVKLMRSLATELQDKDGGRE